MAAAINFDQKNEEKNKKKMKKNIPNTKKGPNISARNVEGKKPIQQTNEKNSFYVCVCFFYVNIFTKMVVCATWPWLCWLHMQPVEIDKISQNINRHTAHLKLNPMPTSAIPFSFVLFFFFISRSLRWLRNRGDR